MSTAVPTELLAKYDRPGPRYTSYPTAPVWRDGFAPALFRARLEAAGRRAGEPLSVYVHVPFCESLCWYCGCNVVITRRRGESARYVDDVLAEADLLRRCVGGERPVAQHHWGGGTPTFLPPAELQRLFVGLGERFPLAAGAEVGVEVDPRVTSEEQLAVLRAAGFNRISMGVQDFDPEVQRAIHREQSFEQTRRLVVAARQLGYWSINLDLVYGLPFQRRASFARTLELVVDLAPDRVACYGYAHVPWLKAHQRLVPESALPGREDKLALYGLALHALCGAGYEPIGMDHFARAGDGLVTALRDGSLHRNFMGYTTHAAAEMLAMGVTAISDVDGAFAQNHRDLEAWRSSVRAGELPVARGWQRTEDDATRRRIILDLMCRFRVAFADYGGAGAFGARFGAELAALAPMQDDGLVRVEAAAIEVTELGRLLVRNLCMAFDAYLQAPGASPRPRYSRTV